MSAMGFDQLGLMISSLDARHDACDVRIGELRRQMDIACGQGHISLREWRMLLDRISLVEKQRDALASQAPSKALPASAPP